MKIIWIKIREIYWIRLLKRAKFDYEMNYLFKCLIGVFYEMPSMKLLVILEYTSGYLIFCKFEMAWSRAFQKYK